MRLDRADRNGILLEAAAWFVQCAGTPGDCVEPRAETIHAGSTAAWQQLANSLVGVGYRTPYHEIGDYMERFWVVPEIFGERLRLHRTLRSDHDRVVHDHPWHFVSVILEGGYVEELQIPGEPETTHRRYRPGDVLFRHAEHRHRLEIEPGQECLSLVFTAPKSREWGFWPDGEFLHWEDFLKVAPTNARELVPA